MFKTFGTGDLGLKAQDLKDNVQMVKEAGFEVPGGSVILSGALNQIQTSIGVPHDEMAERLESMSCPEFLTEINRGILSEMENEMPYAIRSSALSERGGTGIFHTEFFVPNGDIDIDLLRLWQAEKRVYISAYSPDAVAWRQKTGLPAGMAILIQQVEGFRFEDYWLPALSGLAQTSYQGMPTVRLTVGLGTEAVLGGGFLCGPEVCQCSAFHFVRDLYEIETINLINLKTGEVEKTGRWKCSEVFSRISHEAIAGLFDKLEKLKVYGNFCVEWTSVGDRLAVVQCSPYEDKLSGDSSIDSDKYFLLAESDCVFNFGRREASHIVYVEMWNPTIADRLQELNGQLKNFLLVVPQEATSLLSRIGTDPLSRRRKESLGLRHFSNAVAVLESQFRFNLEDYEALELIGIVAVDHLGKRGVCHVEKLFSQTGILFVGAEIDVSRLIRTIDAIPGDDSITVVERNAVIVNDSEQKRGFVYIAK